MKSNLLLSFLGKSVNDKAIVEQLKLNGLTPPQDGIEETTAYIECKAKGFAIEVTEGGFFEEVYQKASLKARFVVSSIFFADLSHGDDYKKYTDTLPLGLSWAMTLESAKSLLGNPAEEDDSPRQLTVYWRKRGGQDIVGGFNKKTKKLEQLNVGLANMYV